MAEARRHHLVTKRGWVLAYEFKPVIYNPSAPAMLIVHGWRSRTEHMTSLIRMSRDLGFRVISLDLPGHGKSSGRQINMANAVEAVKQAETWFGPFQAMIGHSFGGVVVLNAAYGSVRQFEPVETSRMVLISSPNRMKRVFRWFGSVVGLGPKSQRAMEKEVERLTGNPVEVFCGDEQLKSLKVPTLIAHAPDDRQVEFAGAEAMAVAGGHVRLLRADGLGHSRIISDARVLAEIAGFVNLEWQKLAA
ncbi:MAG: alpha/beta fold hydrolase [Rhizobiaceae bacterium]